MTNTLLVYLTRQKTTGANNHQAVQLLRAYEMAIEYAFHRRCPDFEDAVKRVERAEAELRKFAGIVP